MLTLSYIFVLAHGSHLPKSSLLVLKNVLDGLQLSGRALGKVLGSIFRIQEQGELHFIIFFYFEPRLTCKLSLTLNFSSVRIYRNVPLCQTHYPGFVCF